MQYQQHYSCTDGQLGCRQPSSPGPAVASLAEPSVNKGKRPVRAGLASLPSHAAPHMSASASCRLLIQMLDARGQRCCQEQCLTLVRQPDKPETMQPGAGI